MICVTRIKRSILFLGVLLFLRISAREFPEYLYKRDGKRYVVELLDDSNYRYDEYGNTQGRAYYVRLSTESERVIRIGYLMRYLVKDALQLSQQADEPTSFWFDQTDSTTKKRKRKERPKLRRKTKRSRVDTPPSPETPPFVDLDDLD